MKRARQKKKSGVTRNIRKKPIVVAVSGGFDPLHIGHVRLMQHARSLGDKLIVILNNDYWLIKKKGFVFMPQHERKEVIEALASVDKVFMTGHRKNPRDMSVAKELFRIKPHIFANGGDRVKQNTAEGAVCRRIGCRMVFEVGHGGKIQSSSWLLDRFRAGKKK